ncbi:hypothetical protein R3P38DRAFT_2804123 [Favolaschia claudopus]|uniref:Uncharacterized protein n=1 Tax=Favolaschia claudopus TaxID=2862362 RepID=A0AAV9ZQS7_9AGAR
MSQMIYDVNAHRHALLNNPTYLARPGFIQSVGWKEENGGHTLFLHASEPDVADQHGYITQVGLVLPSRYYCGAAGSYSDKYGQPFSNAKYSFLLGRPNEFPELATDWDTSLEVANNIQLSIASGGTPTNWIVDENGSKVIRLGMKIFEKKGGNNPSGIDMTKWPVAANLRDHLAAIIPTHDARHLPLYDEHCALVPPGQIEKKLRGALAEITYKIMRYNFEKDGKIVESITAEIQQIIIKKPGKPQPPAMFSRGAKPVVFAPISTLLAAASASPASAPPASTQLAAPPSPPTLIPTVQSVPAVRIVTPEALASNNVGASPEGNSTNVSGKPSEKAHAPDDGVRSNDKPGEQTVEKTHATSDGSCDAINANGEETYWRRN